MILTKKKLIWISIMEMMRLSTSRAIFHNMIDFFSKQKPAKLINWHLCPETVQLYEKRWKYRQRDRFFLNSVQKKIFLDKKIVRNDADEQHRRREYSQKKIAEQKQVVFDHYATEDYFQKVIIANNVSCLRLDILQLTRLFIWSLFAYFISTYIL